MAKKFGKFLLFSAAAASAAAGVYYYLKKQSAPEEETPDEFDDFDDFSEDLDEESEDEPKQASEEDRSYVDLGQAKTEAAAEAHSGSTAEANKETSSDSAALDSLSHIASGTVEKTEEYFNDEK